MRSPRLRERPYPEFVQLTTDEVREFRALMAETPQRPAERRDIESGSRAARLSGNAVDYAPRYEEGIGITPAMLEKRIERAGHGYLLPAPLCGTLGRMIRGERKWPLHLLHVALEQLGSSLDHFFGFGGRPFWADDAINKIDALVQAPRSDGAAVSTELAYAMRRQVTTYGRIEIALIEQERIAVEALRKMRVYFDAAARMWNECLSAAIKEAEDGSGGAPPATGHS